MIFSIIIFIVVVAVIMTLIVRNYNFNHRLGEGMFKDSEFNLDEKDDFVDKNYYDKDAFNDFLGKKK